MALLDGLLANFKFNADSRDSTGSYVGTDTNITYSTGKVSNCAVFGGSSKVSLGDVLNFERTQPFTIAFWIKFSITTNKVIIGRISKIDHTAKGWVVMCASGYIYLQLNGGTSFQASELQKNFNSGPIHDNNWHLVNITYDGSSLAAGVNFYVDNVQKTAVWSDSNNLSTSILNTDNAMIGSTHLSTDFFAGSLDELSIWNRVLDSTERDNLYNSGNGLAYPFGITPIFKPNILIS